MEPRLVPSTKSFTVTAYSIEHEFRHDSTKGWCAVVNDALIPVPKKRIASLVLLEVRLEQLQLCIQESGCDWESFPYVQPVQAAIEQGSPYWIQSALEWMRDGAQRGQSWVPVALALVKNIASEGRISRNIARRVDRIDRLLRDER